MLLYLQRYRIKRKLDRHNYDFSEFSMESFVRCVEAGRGRRIKFLATVLPPGYYRGWVIDQDEPVEYICYDKNLSQLHQQHVKLHELAHIICGHKTLPLTDSQMKQLLENGGDLSAIVCRSNELQSEKDEREAEMMAAMIQIMAYGRGPGAKSGSSSVAGKSYLSIFCDREQ
ncbi:hypothetical protein ACFLXQ_04070 [Chloroflexota bacterium]